MAVNIGEAWEVEPGQLDAFIANVQTARPTPEDAGSTRETSLWRAIIAGPVVGWIVQATTVEDLAAARIVAAEPAIESDGATSYGRGIETIIAEAGATVGSISWSVHGMIQPGKQDEFRSRIDTWTGMVIDAGANGIRFQQSMANNGEPADGIVAVSYYRDLHHWASSASTLNDAMTRIKEAGVGHPHLDIVEIQETQLWMRLLMPTIMT